MVFLDPKSDIAFKKLFGNAEHKEILISFLNSVLERRDSERIVSVTINNPNNHPETVNDKSSIVDVSCIDASGVKYIVEMQIINRQDFLERCQFYSSIALARQLQKGEEYIKVSPVIFIGVLCFNLFESYDYLSHHLILNSITYEHALKCLEFHFIELKKFDKQATELIEDVDKWIYFLKNATQLETIPYQLDKPLAMQEAFRILEQSNWTHQELDAYERNMDLIRERNSQIAIARDEARVEGKLEGILEGILEGKLEVAKQLLDVLDIKTISKKTGLSIEEIEKLKNR